MLEPIASLDAYLFNLALRFHDYPVDVLGDPLAVAAHLHGHGPAPHGVYKQRLFGCNETDVAVVAGEGKHSGGDNCACEHIPVFEVKGFRLQNFDDVHAPHEAGFVPVLQAFDMTAIFPISPVSGFVEFPNSETLVRQLIRIWERAGLASATSIAMNHDVTVRQHCGIKTGVCK